MVNVERWFSDTGALPYSEAVKLCDDTAVKRVIDIDFVPNEQVDKKLLETVVQITGDDILRHYRADYLKIVDISNPRFLKHLDELAETADILAHHLQRLLRYKDDDDIEAMGDVFGHLKFWRKSNGTIVSEGTDPTKEFEYENQHPVTPHLARWLYIHYEHRFDRPHFNEWNQLSMGNVTCEIIDNLQFLAGGGLKLCLNCPICKDIADGQRLPPP